MSTDSHAQIFLDYAAKAETGDAEAQYQTAICYAQGKGVERSYRNAAHYWLKAAKQQHSEAQMYLGTLFEKGLDVPQDYTKAAQCYSTAAQQGSATAKVRLAMLYYQGLGVSQDTHQAINLFIQAAEQGDAAAQYNLGAAYEKGLGRLTQNQQQAHFWYEQAANQHYPQAIKALSLLDADSTNQPNNTSPLVDEALDKNRVTAEKTVATEALTTTDSQEPMTIENDAEQIFQEGVGVLSANLAQAIDHFEVAAELGHARAQYNMGLAFLFELGGRELSIEKAQHWLEQAAKQELRSAHFVLGWLQQGGLGGMMATDDLIQPTFDQQLAIQHYEKAGELGHAQAQYFLAKIYERGDGVTPDADKSLMWLRQAAKQGYGAAYQELETLIP